MHGWQEPVRVILEQAVQSGGTARTQADEVIDLLGRRGYTAFGALLAK